MAKPEYWANKPTIKSIILPPTITSIDPNAFLGNYVVLIEKTDMLLGLGNVGGIMRNNGRFTFFVWILFNDIRDFRHRLSNFDGKHLQRSSSI